MKTPYVIIVVLAVLGFTSSVFFFSANRSLTSENQSLLAEKSSSVKQLSDLKDEKSKVETELAVLKNTDLAKEIELLRFKLKTAEKDLASAQAKIDTLGKDLAREQQRVKTVEANLGKIKPYLDVADDVQDTYFKYIATEAALDRIESKIKALQDPELLELWVEARRQTSPNSSNPTAVSNVIARAIFLIRNLIK